MMTGHLENLLPIDFQAGQYMLVNAEPKGP
jgi:hypothetical protein